MSDIVEPVAHPNGQDWTTFPLNHMDMELQVDSLLTGAEVAHQDCKMVISRL